MQNNQLLSHFDHQLHQYIHQMQTEVGASRKTLHHLLSEYLDLRNKNEKLNQILEPFHLPQNHSFAPEHFLSMRNLLQRFRHLRESLPNKQALDHPWSFFGSVEHQERDSENLLKSLRFAIIHINKFWIELQSFPLFYNVFNPASFEEIEHTARWLEENGSHAKIKQPRAIPALLQPSLRSFLVEFARNVKCIRLLTERMSEIIHPDLLLSHEMQTTAGLLSEASTLIGQYQLHSQDQEYLATEIQNAEKRMLHLQRCLEFFRSLHDLTELPEPQDSEEGVQALQSLKTLRKIPDSVLPWRAATVINPNQLLRVQAWRDRARPLLETRIRLEAIFQLDAKVWPDSLRDIAIHLTSGGMFRAYRAPYREAIVTYQNLLKPKARNKLMKETDFQMSERLSEWANFLEQTKAFDENPDARKLFAPHFNGIDTDFSAAMNACHWATQIRTDLSFEGSAYGAALTRYAFTAASETLLKTLPSYSEDDLEEIEKLLTDPTVDQKEGLAKQSQENEERFKGLTRLHAILTALQMEPEKELGALLELDPMADEILFLNSQIDAQSDLKNPPQPALKALLSDPTAIEDALFYIELVHRAPISDLIKASLLTSHGPQRLSEVTPWIEAARPLFQLVRDHLEHLTLITGGEFKKLAKEPIPEILTRIQNALKQPTLFYKWIEYLQCMQEVRLAGLETLIEFLDQRSIALDHLEEAFEISFRTHLRQDLASL